LVSRLDEVFLDPQYHHKVRVQAINKLQGASDWLAWKEAAEEVLDLNRLWRGVVIDVDTACTSIVQQNKLKLAKLWLRHSLCDELQNMVTGHTAAQVWSELCKRFERNTAAHVSLLYRELTGLTLGSQETVAEYFSRGEGLRQRFVAAGRALDEEHLAFQLLEGLPEKFSIEIAIINSTHDRLTLSNIRQVMLKQEEVLASRQAQTQAASAYSVDLRRGPQHSAPYVQQYRPLLKCFACGEAGHIARHCIGRYQRRHATATPPPPPPRAPRHPHPHSQPAIQQRAFQAAAQELHVLQEDHTESAMNIGEHSVPGAWMLDSGATRCVTGDKSLLFNYREQSTERFVVYGNGAKLSVVGIGDAVVLSRIGNSITVRDVWYVPGTCANLLSITSLTEIGYTCVFNGSHCNVVKQGKTVLTALQQNRAYLLEGQRYKQGVTVAASAAANIDVWHARLGHISMGGVTALAQKNLVRGLDINKHTVEQAETTDCTACGLAKQARNTFTNSTTVAAKAGHVLHTDLCGPLPQSFGGARYFMVVVDDYSRFSFVHTIKAKSDASSVLQKTIQLVETQTGNKVKTVRSDRGGEFLGTELTDWLTEKGIQRQMTCSYTPQQNGVAERLNRTLVEGTRALLLQTCANVGLWAELLTAKNYTRNRTAVANRNVTPWEGFYGRAPDVSHLRVLGSKTYVQLPKQVREGKLNAVSELGRLVGYSDVSKAYRVLLNGTTTVRETRDVKFVESDHKFEQEATGAAQPTAEKDTLLLETELIYDDPCIQPQQEHTAPTHTTEAAEPTRPVTRSITRQMLQNAPLYQKQKQHDRACQAHGIEEPQSYNMAVNSPQSQFWHEAMDNEMAAHLANGTWEFAHIPPGVRPLGVKWVYKVKTKSDGSFEKYKARVVAQGFRQVEGVDYTEVFAPTSKQATLRALLAVTAAHNLELTQLDVKNAFLQGDLVEEVYVNIPQGYDMPPGHEGMGLLLKRPLYGLKQAPRAWHQKLSQVLCDLGFQVSAADPALYILRGEGGCIYLLTYVDDMLMAGANAQEMQTVKEQLMKQLDIHDLGEPTGFLGMRITRDRDAKTVVLDQEAYVMNCLTSFNMLNAKPASTPLPVGIRLVAGEGDVLPQKQKEEYLKIVGSLLYLGLCTRPDIAHAVGVLSRFMRAPTNIHQHAAREVLRYLNKTRDVGLVYGSSLDIHRLTCFHDADYAGDVDTRKSTTGYVFIMGGAAVAWGSKLQKLVTLSTTEAEYIAAAAAIKEGLWQRKLWGELTGVVPVIDAHCDNQSTIKVLKHNLVQQRSKHIDVQHHFCHERIAAGHVDLKYVDTCNMAADCLTKAVSVHILSRCKNSMGLI